MAVETATRDALMGISVHEVAVGDRVVLDAIYGMEEVLTVDRHELDWWGAHRGSTEAVRIQLKGRYGDPRFVLRFPHEPCVKVTVHRALRA